MCVRYALDFVSISYRAKNAPFSGDISTTWPDETWCFYQRTMAPEAPQCPTGIAPNMGAGKGAFFARPLNPGRGGYQPPEPHPMRKTERSDRHA